MGPFAAVGLELLPGERELVFLLLGCWARRGCRLGLALLLVALPGGPLAVDVAVIGALALRADAQFLGAARGAAPGAAALVGAIAGGRRRFRGDSVVEALRLGAAPLHDRAGAGVLFFPRRVHRPHVALLRLILLDRLLGPLGDVLLRRLALAQKLGEALLRFSQPLLVVALERLVAVPPNEVQPPQRHDALRAQLLHATLRLPQPRLLLRHLVHHNKVVTALVALRAHVRLAETPAHLVHV
mmetsp:Transcript_30533/g.93324  ORF Transcript_30533/g.93324 Transcript_30533/m.93324 type:complete len:242 (-) Transcript_30533:92-817(-)